AVVLAAARGAGQESRPATRSEIEIARMLASDDARSVAWGAWHSRSLDVTRVLAQLTDALAQLRRGAPSDVTRAAALQVPDRLLPARVPLRAEDAETWLDDPRTRAPALALLALGGKDSAELFARLWSDARSREAGKEQQLAGEVLAAARAPGF